MKRFLVLTLTVMLLGSISLTPQCEAGRWNRGYPNAHGRWYHTYQRYPRYNYRYNYRYGYGPRYYDYRYSPYSYGPYNYRYWGGGVYLPGFSVQW